MRIVLWNAEYTDHIKNYHIQDNRRNWIMCAYPYQNKSSTQYFHLRKNLEN